MSSSIYLALMLGTIGLLSLIIVPALLWKRCAGCGARNLLDAVYCTQCGERFPDEDPPGEAPRKDG